MGGMSGKKGGSTPAPDFTKAGTPNTSGPMGGQTWTMGPDGRMQSSMGFTGQAANTFGNVQNAMGKAAAYDPTQARNDAIKSNYDQGWSRLAPMQAQATQGFNSGAANMGLDPGSQAYQAQQGNLQRGQADQQNSLMANATRQGNETQSTQMEQMRQPFLQSGMMMNQLQGGQGNNLGNPLKAAGMQYEAGKDATSAGQGKKGQTMGGLGSLAGTVFGGPLGGMAGGALGSALGGGGGGKGKGGQPGAKQFVSGDPMAGSYG